MNDEVQDVDNTRYPTSDLATASHTLTGRDRELFERGYFEGARHAYTVGIRHGWNERVDHERAAWGQMAEQVRATSRIDTFERRMRPLRAAALESHVPTPAECLASWEVAS
jgi:hypothetical protein